MTELADVMMFAMYFVVAIVMGQLVSRLRWQERAESRREERSTALYLLTRDLADAADVDDMARRLVRQVAQAFKCDVAILLRDAAGGLSPTAHPASMFSISEKEQGVAAWAFRFGKAAGRFTDNLPLGRGGLHSAGHQSRRGGRDRGETAGRAAADAGTARPAGRLRPADRRWCWTVSAWTPRRNRRGCWRNRRN